MQKVIQEHSIVWLPFSKGSDIARLAEAAGDIVLPFLVTGEESSKLNRGEEAAMGDFDLLLGLLVEYFTPPPMSATHKIKPYFKDILLSLLKERIIQQGFDSIEQCIMALSSYLKETCGERLSYKVLKAGLEIMPESLEIKKALLEGEA